MASIIEVVVYAATFRTPRILVQVFIAAVLGAPIANGIDVPTFPNAIGTMKGGT